ncbi:MAG: hypothetical protein R3F20_10840 [Planctomycetota bacterium]
MRIPSFLRAVSALVLLVSALPAQEYATQVLSIAQGPGSGVFTPANALGGPDYASSGYQSVFSLGAGGDAVFGFAHAIRDGAGADFIVFENAFELFLPPTYTMPSGDSFAEVAFVEVSTNGIDFARFPTSYNGPDASHGVFGGSTIGSFAGFAGSGPVYADLGFGGISPGDAALAGGDAFDLAALVAHPLVTAGLVDLQQINFLRLVDVQEGTAFDSFGNTIWDDRGNDPLDSADIDAIAVLNHTGNATAIAPDVALERDAADRLLVTVSDPQGLGALVPSSFVTSLNYQPIGIADFLFYFSVWNVTGDAITFRSNVPASTLPADFVFGLSIANLSGKRSSTTLAIQQ